jgi:hypothetical protein
MLSRLVCIIILQQSYVRILEREKRGMGLRFTRIYKKLTLLICKFIIQ